MNGFGYGLMVVDECEEHVFLISKAVGTDECPASDYV